MKISIREFQEGDEECISKLHNRAVRAISNLTLEEIEEWSSIRDDYTQLKESLLESFSYVALNINNQIVGFSDFMINQGDGLPRILRLYVDPPFQKSGIGKQLLLVMENRAKQLGFHRIILETSKIAQGFYLARGYVKIGEKEVFGRMEWVMHKDL
ncbi:MAG: GNAT family N-acetyltransferase [Candidatus Woesearchaeota archaeon]